VIVVETEKGTFEFETYPNEAPKTVAHIIGLVNKRFFNGQRVHRVVPGFIVQMGDQQTRDMTKEEMWGRAVGPQIGVAEFSKLRTHVRGAVAMAHNGGAAKADTQFYITLAAAHRLDSDFVVFGKVISGMDVVQKLQYADRIVRVTVRAAK
jgi:peptidyl-prolyl cis-trans isomerase B (cyclophilin B)